MKSDIILISSAAEVEASSSAVDAEAEVPSSLTTTRIGWGNIFNIGCKTKLYSI